MTKGPLNRQQYKLFQTVNFSGVLTRQEIPNLQTNHKELETLLKSVSLAHVSVPDNDISVKIGRKELFLNLQQL